jgi:alpha-L-fucosidase
MPYQATRESLRTHAIPDWFHDAKLGIFIHWGLFSVPAYAPLTGEFNAVVKERGWRAWFASNPYAEWYGNSIRIPGSPSAQHHQQSYGGQAYAAFAPRFREAVKGWRAEEWAELFCECGAAYVVMVTKHHDGFTLWPSRQTNPHAPGFESQRDLVGELAEAVRKRGMRFGAYYSGGLDWTFHHRPIRTLTDLLLGIPQSREYAAYADQHLRELIERYEPSVLWGDIGYPKAGHLEAIFADYYNRVPDGIINDRFNPTALPAFFGLPGVNDVFSWAIRQALRNSPAGLSQQPTGHYDFRTPEYATLPAATDYKWESTRGLGYSFGYNQLEGEAQALAPARLIHEFVDVVSKNGNLLLNLGPMADGTLPPLQVERLQALGDWLRVNGEAIYGTRPHTPAEGQAQVGGQSIPVRFTRKGVVTYAVLLGTPPAGELQLEGIQATPGLRVSLLGRSEPLPYNAGGAGLTITLPRLPDSPAHALRIEPG